MKKYIIGITAILYSFLCVNMLFAAANTWTQKADFGGIAQACGQYEDVQFPCLYATDLVFG
jgi:hypothetical protein